MQPSPFLPPSRSSARRAPLARPGLAAFAIVSVTAHWNEFLWPLMAVSSPSRQVLTVGLASAATVMSVAALLALSLTSFRLLERGIYYES